MKRWFWFKKKFICSPFLLSPRWQKLPYICNNFFYYNNLSITFLNYCTIEKSPYIFFFLWYGTMPSIWLCWTWLGMGVWWPSINVDKITFIQEIVYPPFEWLLDKIQDTVVVRIAVSTSYMHHLSALMIWYFSLEHEMLCWAVELT